MTLDLKTYQTILEHSSAMIFVVDKNHSIQYANPAACKHIGDINIKERSLAELYPERIKKYSHEDAEVFRTGKPKLQFIENFVSKNNQNIWFQVDRIPLTDEHGNVTSIIHSISDITAQIQYSKDLQKIEEMFTSAFDNASIGMAVVSTEGKWLKVNKALCQSVGYSPEELFEIDFQTITHPDDLEADLGYVQQMLNREIETYQMKKRYYHKDGHIVWILLSVSLVWDEDKPLHFISQIQDISNNVYAEHKLDKTKKRLERALDGTRDGIWDWPDITKDEKYWSPRFKQLLGYEDNEIDASYTRFLELIHPDDRHRTTRAVQRFIDYGKPFDVEYRMKTKSGGYKWFQGKGNLTIDPETRKRRMSGSISDINDRKLIEKQVNNMYQALANAVEGISKIDDSLHFNYINDALAKIAGYKSAEELIEKPSDIIIHPEDRDTFKQLFVQLETCSKISAEVRGIKKNKSLLYLQLVIVHDPLEKEYYCFVRDVTKRKKTEKKLEKAVVELTNSNIELERFAYVCSHDLQEPLRIISNYCQLILAESVPSFDQNTKTYFKFIQDNAARMSELITDVLNYSRISQEDNYQETIDLNGIVKETLQTLHLNIIGRNATIDINGTLPSIHGNRIQISQIFNNLVGNALKFCKDKKPHIEISCTESDKEWQVNIKDNGIGIEAEYQHKIFDVFKRLHKHSEYYGTGIGLAICKKVVERHGGNIFVQSTPGEGSTFSFTLPKKQGKLLQAA
jgi:PAS domain S-box-containing protein